MRNPIFLAALCLLLPALSWAQSTRFERSGGTETATHAECIAFYDTLAQKYPRKAKLLQVGMTDVGRPLHLFVVGGPFNPAALGASPRNKRVLLINNAIHPGEPEGVDASMLFARALLSEPAKYASLLERTVVLIVPMYNVDGVLNRSRSSRANQNGPVEYGFRGNAENLDLNRDCAKLDSRNAQALAQVFRDWDPDVFIDTHTSNGADYQHTMTLIETVPSKLGGPLDNFQHDTLTPYLYKRMTEMGWDMVPYVVTRTDLPDSGLVAFPETPRFTTGLAALRGTSGYVAETHMLKPFKPRVESTRDLLFSLLEMTSKYGDVIQKRRAKWINYWSSAQYVPFNWKVDYSKSEKISFKGYTATFAPGPVTGLPLRHFDHTKPWTRDIDYFFTYIAQDSTHIPEAWVLPQAWYRVVERLQMNGVEMHRLRRDTVMQVVVEYIESYKTTDPPYEGHYLHYEVRTRPDTLHVRYYAGDYVIPARQRHTRLVAELLDPRNPDSYFAWNFFDAILMQKEGFSDYVFEPRAVEILNQNPAMKAEYERKKASDPAFAADHMAQLDFIYKRSEYYEPTHRRYPVGRLYKVPERVILEPVQPAAPLGRDVHE